MTGTILYAYTFVFFTGTVVFALVNSTSNWDALVDRLGAWMTIHGGLMVMAGLILGVAVARAGVFSRWTGWTLAVGVVLIGASSGLPPIAQAVSAGVRDLAFVAMGASLLIRRTRLGVAPPLPLPVGIHVKRKGRAS